MAKVRVICLLTVVNLHQCHQLLFEGIPILYGRTWSEGLFVTQSLFIAVTLNSTPISDRFTSLRNAFWCIMLTSFSAFWSKVTQLCIFSPDFLLFVFLYFLDHSEVSMSFAMSFSSQPFLRNDSFSSFTTFQNIILLFLLSHEHALRHSEDNRFSELKNLNASRNYPILQPHLCCFIIMFLLMRRMTFLKLFQNDQVSWTYMLLYQHHNSLDNGVPGDVFYLTDVINFA